MKVLSLVLMLSAPASAMACPHSRQQFVCPGDAIVDAGNNKGILTAVNPFQHTASYQAEYLGMLSAPIETLALAAGCLEALCVGDAIVDDANNKGIVAAVNPYNGTVAYEAEYLGMRSASVRTLKVARGCSLGYCVGDAIVDDANNKGIIIALSPYDDSAAYQAEYLGMLSAQIETLSSTQYCAEYGESHPARQARHYPSLPTNRYAAPDFRYYQSRK